MKQLLREFKLFEMDDVQPATSVDGILVMKGVLQRANVPNANNRIYPKPLLEREDKKMQDIIAARGAIGELDHPESPIVQLENGSHVVTKTWWDGDNLLGEIEVLDTPKGKILESYVRRGIRMGISSRGLGSTRQADGGYDVVEDDFQLVTYDMVSNPSTHGAYMSLKENKEWKIFCEQNIFMKIDDILDEILKLK